MIVGVLRSGCQLRRDHRGDGGGYSPGVSARVRWKITAQNKKPRLRLISLSINVTGASERASSDISSEHMTIIFLSLFKSLHHAD